MTPAGWRTGVARVTMVTPGTVFTPQGHFGGNDLLTLSVGCRIGAGARRPRMGRYSVLAAGDAPARTPTTEHRHE